MSDDEYWAKQRLRLDVSDDVRHVDFARFVADQCGNGLRYVRHVGWFKWNGRVWSETGDDGAAFQAVTDAALTIYRRIAHHSGDMGWGSAAASKLKVHRERAAIVKEMAVLPELHTDVDEMDKHRHLLSFQNGTVDLRTGELRSHDPVDMITQMAPVDYNPGAVSPRWLRFMDEVFPGEEDVQGYVQTFLGMCVTGEVRDHAIGVWYGSQGRNGKGTIVRTMTAGFGKEIIKEVDFSTWELRGEVHPETIAGLRGARMVVSQEGTDAPMHTARLKNFSGGDRISARHLYGKQFTYDPKFTIVLATNHLPEFSAGGPALWARTKAVHFGQSFADRPDPELEPLIQGPELPGVVAWVVAGAQRYYAQGRLRDPFSVVQATEHHRDEVDPLKPLVGELFDYDSDSEIKRSAFNAELKQWREDNGEKSGKFSPSQVKRQLLANGVSEHHRKGVGWVYRGVYLMSAAPRQVEPGHGIFAASASADGAG